MRDGWTFGIITSDNPSYLKEAIDSIEKYGPPKSKRQIILVGGNQTYDYVDIWIPFNEAIKSGWITKKKNVIANIAECINLCLMHDYVALMPGWYDGVLKWEEKTDRWSPTCMHRIFNMDGTRFRDWCMIFNDAWMEPPIDDQKPPNGDGRLLQYDNYHHGRWQYYSGAYFCVQTLVLRSIPFDENRCWGQGEDVQWSRLLYNKFHDSAFMMNPLSSVRFLKQKQRAPWEQKEPL